MVTKKAVPSGDAPFDVWLENFSSVLANNPEKFRISPEDVQQLVAGKDRWTADYSGSITARDAARAAVEAKDLARNGIEEFCRELMRRIQADSRVTDASRREAGMPVHKSTRTPVAVPTSAPRGQVIGTDRLEQVVSVTDAGSTGRRAKPAGVVGCEVYMCIAATAPQNPSDYQFMGVWTRSTERMNFKAEDSGKTAHYLFRWMNTKGQTGPWSDITSATIPAV
ncbi:MAG: hypothetical protein R3C49_11330 [Planctomycetaceae bacterium]